MVDKRSSRVTADGTSDAAGSAWLQLTKKQMSHTPLEQR